MRSKTLILWVVVASCGTAAASAPTVFQQRETVLNRIADRCLASRSAWQLIDANHLTLRGNVHPGDKSTNCLINELFKSKLPVKFGFVGREYYPEKKP